MKKPTILFIILLILSCSKGDGDSTQQTDLPKFNLSVSTSTGGTVSTSGGTFEKGTKVTITAIPDAEYLFENWSNGSATNPIEVTVNSNMSIAANFALKTYALTVDIDGEGTVVEEIVNPGKSPTDYTKGTTVKLTAEPSDEWKFISWSGALESVDNPVELTVDAAKQITAHFEIVQYNLNITTTSGGTVDIYTGSYDSGTELTVTATPESDFIFSHWSDDSEENPRTITLNSDVELNAIFQNKFQIEDGYYLHIGTIYEGEFYGYDSTFVFEYSNNEAISCGAVYNDLASFPIFKDIGYVPGQPDDALSDVLISRNRVNREYLNAGVLTSWVVEKIDESEIPYKRTHEEIMTLVDGKGFWSDPIYSQIDPLVPETYVIAFLADAARHGVDLSFVDVNQILVEFREEGYAGLSHLHCFDDERVNISYNIAFWNSASYYDIQNERLTVMYHELGHDILNSGHPATGTMKQFMNQALGDAGPIVWDDADPMFSFRRMVDDMFSGVGLDYPCANGSTDYSAGAGSGKAVVSENSYKECFPLNKIDVPKFE